MQHSHCVHILEWNQIIQCSKVLAYFYESPSIYFTEFEEPLC